MANEKHKLEHRKISPAFAAEALAALEVPLDKVEDREVRLLYRLHGVEESPPPRDAIEETREFQNYYSDLWYRNTFTLRDVELANLRRELGFRIFRDPDFTEQELCAELSSFYRSRIPSVE